MALDQDKLMDFVHRFVGDLGGTMTAANVVVGHQTGLYRGLDTGGPATGDCAGRSRRRWPSWASGPAGAGPPPCPAACPAACLGARSR